MGDVVTGRVKTKCATLAQWHDVWQTFIPMKGELVVISDGIEGSLPGIKVGDGVTNLYSLQYVSDIRFEDLDTVAWTGNYNDLNHKPDADDIPYDEQAHQSYTGTDNVGDAIEYLDHELSTKASIHDLPTKTSDLVNDSGFITSGDIPSKTSDLINDSGFITEQDMEPIFVQFGYHNTELIAEIGGQDLYDAINGSRKVIFFTTEYIPNKEIYFEITSAFWDESKNRWEFSGACVGDGIIASLYAISKLGDTQLGIAIHDVVVPIATSNLINDSGFITSAALPTKTSDLTNDSGFIAGSSVPSYEQDPTVSAWAKASSKPSYTAAEVGALPNTGESILDGTNSVLNLKSASATNSPILRFQRGTLTDNYNDWQIQDRGGFLYFDQRGSGSSAFSEMVHFDTSGNVYATGFKGYLDWSYVSNKPTIPTQTSQLTNNSGFITGADVPSNETDPTVPNWAKASSKPSYTASEVGALPDTTVIPSATSQLTNDSGYITSSAIPTNVSAFTNDVPYAVANSDGASLSTMAIPKGEVDSTSTATVFTATVSGITQLKTGVCMMLSNHVVTSASGFTININGLGAKPVYSNMTNATRDTTIFNVAYTMLFVYDETLDSGNGGWWCYRGYNSDNNTIGYIVRSNSLQLPVDSACYRYRLLFTSMDGQHYIPANNSTSTNATAKRNTTQTPFDPFGRIIYYGYTTALSAGGKPGTAYQFEQQVFALGYSFNRTGAALTLTEDKPVWLKAAPQSDGSVILSAETPFVQDLPTTEDGFVYIWLGIAYSATNVELTLQHPVKYYKDGAIRNWLPAYYSAAQGRSF